MSEQDQVLETTNSNEEVVLEETTEEENLEALKAENEELRKKAEQFPNVVARAKKAEEELKAYKAKAASETTQTLEEKSTLTERDVDVKILQSQGLDEEAIEFLKKLAAVNGTSVLAAQSDELYSSFKDKREAKEKSEKAALGASRGSSPSKKQKDTTTPGLSDEDHKALWKQKQGM